MTACFIDTMRPVTPAEEAAWRLFLSLPSSTWRDARMMFRRVRNGMTPFDALAQFVGVSGYEDKTMIAALEAVLQELAGEVTR